MGGRQGRGLSPAECGPVTTVGEGTLSPALGCPRCGVCGVSPHLVGGPD